MTREQLRDAMWREYNAGGVTFADLLQAYADRATYPGAPDTPTRGWVARLIADARAWYETNDTGAGDAESVVSQESGTDARARFTVPTYTYTGSKPGQAVPRFTGAWQLEGDFMVVNDVHIPATDWAFADLMLRVAETHLPRPRKLIIAGDLINGDALSRWDDLVLCTPLADELDYAEMWLNHVSGVFDEIYFSRGNHENRLLLSMKGQLHAPQFLRMISDNGRVQFSMYGYLEVVSGGQRWRLSHQRNYSSTPLTVARKLAAKHHCHIISAHQHHSAIGRDASNTYAVIDSGGLHDSDLMAYVMLDDSTSPNMANGFVLLQDGVGTLFTPQEYALTDWSQWLPDADAWQVAA